MQATLPFVFAIIAIGFSLLFKPLARKLLIPFPLLLVISGFVIAEIITHLGYDSGIRYDNFYPINNLIFLPILVFSTAFNLGRKHLWRDIVVVLSLTIPVLLLTVGITAVLLYFGINLHSGFPWIAALITGALLAATQSRGITDLLRQIRTPPRIIALIESESLLSGTVAIVVFNFFIMLATQNLSEQHNIWYWSGSLLNQIMGGALVGCIVGIVFYGLLKITPDESGQALITIIAAYLAYLVAQSVLNVSGAIATFCVAAIFRSFFKRTQHPFIHELWDYNALLATIGVYLLVGAVITPQMFSERWLAMLIGITSIFIARNISVYGCLSLVSYSKLAKPISFSEQTMIALCGMRGAITIALAFSIPTNLNYWWTIQSIAFGVVLFTLCIQAPIASHYIYKRVGPIDNQTAQLNT